MTIRLLVPVPPIPSPSSVSPTRTRLSLRFLKATFSSTPATSPTMALSSFEELQAQLDWLGSLPHRHKIITAGNHDKLLDPEYVARFPDRFGESEGQARAELEWHDVAYLNNSSKTLELAGLRRLNVFGSPCTPKYGTFAFQYPPIRDVWTGAIPDRTDVLLSHGPPKGYLDLEGKGCPQLTREVARTRPRLVVFGHIHRGHGREEVGFRRVETNYQKVMAGDEGLGAVLRMVFWLLGAWLWHLVCLALAQRNYRREPRTTLVNAAVVGGMNNEESLPASVLNI